MIQSVDLEKLHTVQLVPITAFDAQGRLNLEPMRGLTRRLFDAGIRCFIPCAGSAEFHGLTDEEIVTVIEMTREVTGDQAVIMAPIGFQVERALQLGQRACDAGADSVLVMPLSFPYLSDVGAREYYARLLDGLPCPVVLYKKEAIPSDQLLLELAEHPNLGGVKYAMNDIDAFNRIVQNDGGRTEWYCGNAERFAPFFFLAGATGYTSGAGNVCPRVTLAMHAALAAGQWDEAFKWQRILLPIEEYRARAANSYNVSFLKHAVTHLGLDFGDPRPPYRPLTNAEKQEIDQLMSPILAAERELADAEVAV